MKRCTLLFSILLFSGVLLFAGRPELGLPFIRNFTPKDYGAAPQNWAVVQDSRGILYVANTEGVLEYDGVRWRKIRIPNGTAARALDIDASGRIYVGAIGEIGYLAPDAQGQTTYVSLLDRMALKDRDFMGISMLRATPQGVFFLGANRMLCSNGAGIRSWEGVFNGLFFVHGRLFTSQKDRGLLELVGDELQLVPGGEIFAKDRLSFLDEFPAQPTSILIGTRKGLFLMGGLGIQPLSSQVGSHLEEDLLYRGSLLPDGRVVLNTIRNGVHILERDGSPSTHLGKATGLRDDTVLSSHAGLDGSLLLGLNDGLAWVQMSGVLTTFGEMTGLRGGVLAVHRHREELYVGTDVGVFHLVIAPGRSPKFMPVLGISNQTWNFLSIGSDLLVANNDGLYSIRGDKAQKIGKQVDLWCLLASKVNSDRVFVGMEGGICSLIRRNEVWVEEEKLPGITEVIRTLGETSDGRLWAGTGNQGVLRISFGRDWKGGRSAPVRVERFGTSHGLPSMNHNRVYRLHGETVFATHQGIYRFDAPQGRFLPDGRFSGLFPSPRWIFALDQDSRGRVWVHSCDEARSLHETGAAILQADGTYRWEASALLPISDTGVEFIRAEEDGIVWIGSADGLYRYDADASDGNEKVVSVLLRRVSQAGGALLFGGDDRIPLASPSLKYKGNRLRFEFAIPSFEKSDANLYQVLMEGYDPDWSAWSSEPFKEFTNLHEGRYRFRVRGRDCHGRITPEATYAFRILPPWYRTWWAYGGMILVLAGLGYGLLRWRLWWLHKENRDLENRVRERTQELAETNRKLRDSQDQVARLMESPQDMLENIPAWASMVADDLQRILQVRELGVYEIRDQRLVPIRALSEQPPDITRIQAALSCDSRLGDLLLVGARGLTGELRGVLLVSGASSEDSGAERQLLLGFASQFASALEMVQVRRRLMDAEIHHSVALEELHAKGIATLAICPTCGACYGHEVSICREDGAILVPQGAQPLRILDRYRFTRRLGSGGMGAVFEAWDENLSRTVAVKLLLPELFHDATARLRFEREARILVQVNHPGVVTVFDSGEIGDGSMYLIMERLQGVDLASLLYHRGPGTPAQVARLVRKAASALDAAHRIRIVHRDIKPQNIFLVQGQDGFQPKLLDFGLAKTDGVDTHLTRTGFMMGTPLYMTPEQILGREADERSDFFSFAAVIYEALLGRQAAGGLVLADIIQSILYDAPLAPTTLASWLPREVDALFLAALEKDPAKRPSDFMGWAQSLASLLETCNGTAAGWPKVFSELGAPVFSSLNSGIDLTSMMELPGIPDHARTQENRLKGDA